MNSQPYNPLYGALLSNQGADKYGLPYSIVDYGGNNKVPSLGQYGDVTYVDPNISQKDVSRDSSFIGNIHDVLGQNDRSNLDPSVIEAIYKALGIGLLNGRPGLTPSQQGVNTVQQYFNQNNIPVIKTPPLQHTGQLQ